MSSTNIFYSDFFMYQASSCSMFGVLKNKIKFFSFAPEWGFNIPDSY